MALISQNFKNDSISTTLYVKPVIILASQDLENNRYNILDVFSTDNVILNDNYDTTYQAKEIVDRISSIKNSVDYENRKLKINTFRFTLRNYYDFNKTLTNSDKYKINIDGENPINNFMGSYVILYYKTQTTNTLNIDLEPVIQDDDCAIIFTGIINRVDQDDKSIKIQAEDNVQSYIADKSLPRIKGSDLPATTQYTDIEPDTVIPMVYGKVDRVPTYRFADYRIADWHKITDIFTTKKVIGNPFSVYATPDTFSYSHSYYYKGDDDWLGTTGFLNLLLNGLQEAVLNSSNEPDYSGILIGEITGADSDSSYSSITPTNCLGYLLPDRVFLDMTGLNPIFSGDEFLVEDYILPNNKLSSNNGYEFLWYRADDVAASGNFNPNYNTSLNTWTTEYMYFSSSTHDHKAGRWVIIQLKERYRIDSVAGQMLKHSSDFPSQFETNVGADFYVKPLNHSQFSNIIQNGATLQQVFYDTPLNNADFEPTGTWVSHRFADDDEEVLTAGNFKEAEVDKIIFFEYFNKGEESPFEVNTNPNDISGSGLFTVNENQSSGVNKRFNLNGNQPLYIRHREFVEDEIVYSSITGRKDINSTESLSLMNDIAQWQLLGVTSENVTLQEIIDGIDNTIPLDFDTLLNAIENYFNGLANYVPEPVSQWHRTYSWSETIGYLDYNTANEHYSLGESSFYNQVILDTDIFNIDDNSILHHIFIWTKIMQLCYRKIMMNVMELEAREYLDAKVAAGENVYVHGTYYYDVESGNVNYNNDMSLIIYDPNTMSEDQIGYSNFRTYILENMMKNIAESNNPDYNTYGLIEEESTHFADIWNNNYVDLRRCLFRRILKYVYQNDLGVDTVDDMFSFSVDWDLGTLTDFDINTNDAIINWDNEKRDFLDDVVFTINTGIFDYSSTTIGDRWQLYDWVTESNLGSTVDTLTTYGGMYPYSYQTDGVVVKPVDIIIDILTKEMIFGLNDLGLLNANSYDEQSIYKARDYYADWRMGFCINKEIDGKKLIENILSETMSYFSFSPQGKFSLVTVKEKYTYDDVDYFIDEDDILKYKFSRTKREDLILQSKFLYRYDNGFDNYPFKTDLLKIEDLIPDYNGYDYYNLDEVSGYKEKELRYHTETDTVNLYHQLYLLNNCNQHLKVKIDLPLNYADIKISDIINLPLINNDPVFGLDYSRVELLNSQPIYPAFIVTTMDIKLDKVSIEAYQLHYLGTDGLHGFHFADENMNTVANLNEFNTIQTEIRNWNYLREEDRNPDYTYIQGVEIPYGDVNGDGNINVVDVINILNHILALDLLNATESERISMYDFITNTINSQPEPINVVKVVQIIDKILGT